MQKGSARGFDCAALPVIATVAPLLRQDRHRDCARYTGSRPIPQTLSRRSQRRSACIFTDLARPALGSKRF